MAYEIIMLSVGCIVVAITIFALNFFSKRKSNVENQGEEVVVRPRGVPMNRGPAGNAPRRAGRNVRDRMRAAVNMQDEDFEEDDDPLAEEIAMPEGKIGAKKRRKLEMKAEKKMQRERELEEREERKQRQQELDERRKTEDDALKEDELRKEAEEKALKEEKERQDLEEYLKLKEAFEVEEEGFDQEIVEEGHKFQDFIEYIKEQKVVLLEDLAMHFKLKTQDVINRIQDLLAQETIVGVMDDRGKFVYITMEELESVAQFVKQRGRVSISELAENSNNLIKLQTQPPLPVST